jgi:hypothetical protein
MKKHISSAIGTAFFSALALVSVFYPVPGQAAEQKLALTVTPPLFQISVKPGDSWNSILKLVNSNPYDLTLYASPVNFESNNEQGYPQFIPILKGGDVGANSLAEWINLSREPVLVPSGKSVDLPFEIKIPPDAAPGSHYAAILVGTNPSTDKSGGSQMKIASFVSSLIFARVQGNVVEDGFIRQFSTGKNLYQKPEVDFTLRFENRGNVHLQPQGEIAVYNMWGKERGRIPVNQDTLFGNVLPKTVRNFSFAWKGEENIFDFGRYTAVATLVYGDDARKNVSAAVEFWIVPLKPVLGVLGGFIAFLLLLGWSIRTYVRKVLALSRGDRPEGVNISKKERPISLRSFVRPLQKEVVDLRNLRQGIGRNKSSTGMKTKFATVMKKYALIFLISLAVVGGGVGVVLFFGEVMTSSRNFEVVVNKNENILKAAMPEKIISGVNGVGVASTTKIDKVFIGSEDFVLKVMNGSGIPGEATRVSATLKNAGFKVSESGNAQNFGYEHTIIRYDDRLQEKAAAIGKVIADRKPVFEESSSTAGMKGIIVILGKKI